MTDPELFAATAEAGDQLARLHLLEATPTATPRIEGAGDLTVTEHARHDAAAGERLYINAKRSIQAEPSLRLGSRLRAVDSYRP